MAGDVCKAEGLKWNTCPSLPRRLLPPFSPGLPPSFLYRYFFPRFLPVFSIHPFLTFCPASCLFCSFGASFVSRMPLSSSSASVQREVRRFLQRFEHGSVDSPQSPANAAGQEPASTFAATHAEAGQTLPCCRHCRRSNNFWLLSLHPSLRSLSLLSLSSPLSPLPFSDTPVFSPSRLSPFAPTDLLSYPSLPFLAPFPLTPLSPSSHLSYPLLFHPL